MDLIALGSILIGIAVIAGLMREGEMGCLGGCLITLLVFILIISLLGAFLMSIGGDML